jgi:GNAT superfamily N-acetyltransferase
MPAPKPSLNPHVRAITPADFGAVTELSKTVYPFTYPWTRRYLRAHHGVFPDGQLVAVDQETGRILGHAATLRLRWSAYDPRASYTTMTGDYTFENHDPHGDTLYGAEVMVHPDARGRGVGKALYAARERLARASGTRHIRAGARLRGFGSHAHRLTIAEYFARVVDGTLTDPTVTFQIRQGFVVTDLVPHYLDEDPESQGYAASIEREVHSSDAPRAPELTDRAA